MVSSLRVCFVSDSSCYSFYGAAALSAGQVPPSDTVCSVNRIPDNTARSFSSWAGWRSYSMFHCVS
jgi:hypothetical protein